MSVLAPLRHRIVRQASDRAAFEAQLGPPPTAPAAVGVEHEFVVLAREASIDFRDVLGGLAIGQARLDPDDAFSRRLPTGSVITCDGPEAEVAVAPVQIRPGFAVEVTRDAQGVADTLAAALPRGHSLRGFSTHISIDVPNDRVVEVGRTFVTRFGPRLLALMDGPDAPGLRVRPRFQRLELCGDHVSGARLEAAVEFAAGGVAACLLAASADRFAPPLPEPVLAGVRPAIERPGWFIDNGAVANASDPAAYGLADGGRLSIAQHDDRATAAAAVGLRRWLEKSGRADRDAGDPATIATSPADYGRAISATSRPAYDLAPVMVTWPVSVFLALMHGRNLPRFIVVPRAWLGRFLHKLDRGELDDVIARNLALKGPEYLARDWRDAGRPGFFDGLPSRLSLLPPEPM